jgi:hypothetical protein
MMHHCQVLKNTLVLTMSNSFKYMALGLHPTLVEAHLPCEQ